MGRVSKTLGIRTLGLALLLGLLALGGGNGLLAQDATPAADQVAAGRPAHIHSGTCEQLGDVVVPLTFPTAPEGETVGQAAAVVAETSVSNVPMTLDAILAEEHAINVHLSEPEIATYIACGEIGGVIDANGALTIGLKESSGSGFSGIAYLAPGADGASTDISIFIAEGLTGAAAGGGAEETPAAGAGEAVAVSLTEFAIDMPTELPAGSTTFSVSNDGEFPHNLEIEGQGIEAVLPANLEAGQSGELTVDLVPGTYEAYCPVGNHRDRGMLLELTVTE
jgi:uncharacterized cupredoxin-like copper-binding protein